MSKKEKEGKVRGKAKEKKKKLTSQEKKEEKLLRKKKKLVGNGIEIYDPEKTQSFEGSVFLGYFLRLFTVAFAAFAVVFMVCNSFEVSKEVNGFFMFLFCLGSTVAVALLFYGKWYLTLAGLGLMLAYVGLVTVSHGNPLTFFVTGIDDFLDKIFSVIRQNGFPISDFIDIPSFGGANERLKGGTYMICFAVSFFFTVFSLRKVHLAPFVILGTAVSSICFIYNISGGNWGIAFLITALCAMISLARYDKAFIKNKKSKKSRAYGGYVSAVAGVLCFAVVAVPALGVKKSFHTIDFIQNPMEDIRAIVTTIMLGGDIENNKMNSLHEEVDTEFEDIEITGDVLFSVTSYANRPLYLRSWIADDYNIGTDAWNILSEESYKELSDAMRKDGGKVYSGDEITYMLYSLFYHYTIGEDTFPRDKAYITTSNAYSATMVDIEYVGNSGLLYVLPSAYAAPIGLHVFNSHSELYDEKVNVYSDGMYTSTWMNLFKSYSAPVIIPNYQSPNYESLSEKNAKYFKLLVKFVDKDLSSTYYSLEDEVINELDCVKDFIEILRKNGLSDMGIGPLRDYLKLSKLEQRKWYDKYVRAMNAYTKYINENYLDVPNSDALSSVHDELLAEFESAETTHAKIMVVIDYLCENYEYSLTPMHDPEFEGSVLDEFLLSKNEGYCVQFASAAALLLRSFGIPARYVQGYMVSDYGGEVRFDENGEKYYDADVTDENAHAWVEVYIEGLGWRAYETTPASYDSVYVSNSDILAPPEPGLPDITPPSKPKPETKPTTPEEEITDELDEEENTFDLEKFMRLLSILAVAVIIAAVVLIVVRRARNIRDGRNYAFERAIYSSFTDGYDRRMLAVGMTDLFYSTMSVGGDDPERGESLTEFAERIERMRAEDLESKGRRKKRAELMMTLPYDINDMVNIILKREFSGEISDEELSRLAEYVSALQKYEYESKNIFAKIWHRYITCKL